MADLEIKVCETGGGVYGNDAGVCNVVEPKDVDPLFKKYKEAMEAYKQYEKCMAELQGLMEEDIGRALILVGNERPNNSLEALAERYGVNLYKDTLEGAL